ncbi:cytosolic superoxide dismutase, partial [Globomyces pollinis-pini]
VTGTVKFEQSKESEQIKITYKIIGLPPNTEHGWHVHNLPLANLRNCSSAGLHFNPKNVTHGAPTDEIRHYGDLGNMKSNADGVAEFTVTDRLLSLFGELNTLNRAIVVHALQDDLGKGGNATSLTVGNSGARLGCGNIELI